MSQLAVHPQVSINPPAKGRRVIPGFGLSMGYTLTYLSLIVLIPSAVLIGKSLTLSRELFWKTISSEAVLSAYRVSFGASAIAALVDGFFGLIIAWTLVRYRFPLRRFFDALIDLPFALPTAVAGITLGELYSPEGWLGRLKFGTWITRGLNHLPHTHISAARLSWLDLDYSYHYGGIVIALVFVGLPFVVRSVQPVLQDLDRDVEEAAESLGATRWYTFRRIIFPALLPAWLSGLAMAFARAIGEYGSVIFISSNKPNETDIVPNVIVGKVVENGATSVAQATAVAVVLLLSSLLILLLINGLQWWSRRYER